MSVLKMNFSYFDIKIDTYQWLMNKNIQNDESYGNFTQIEVVTPLFLFKI